MDHSNHIFIEAQQDYSPPAIAGETDEEYIDRVGINVLEPKPVLWCLECNCKIDDDDE